MEVVDLIKKSEQQLDKEFKKMILQEQLDMDMMMLVETR